MFKSLESLAAGADIVFFVYAPWIEMGFGLLALFAIYEFFFVEGN
jgi:hypothetical protein